MTQPGDWNDDMVLLDHHTADRLVRGAIAPDDAPPGYAEVAALLRDVRDEPVVIDEADVLAVTAAVQSTVAAPRRAGVRSWRSRRRLPAAIAGGVAIAMFVAPVAARVARHIDLVGTGDDEPAAEVVTPADARDGSGETQRPSGASNAKQHSRAPLTPAADRAAVTVPVASDAPAQPQPQPGVPAGQQQRPAAPADATGPGGVKHGAGTAQDEPTGACVRGAEAAAKPDRACPGEQRVAETSGDDEPAPEQRGRPAR